MECVPQTAPDIVAKYAGYLTEDIAAMKFMDKDELRGYLSAHLQIFFSEALDDSTLDKTDQRIFRLQQQMQQLNLERVGIEEQLLKAKSDLKNRKRVDTDWMARTNYAFRIKGVQVQSINHELGQLSLLRKRKNIEMANTKDRREQELFREHLKELFGKEWLVEQWTILREKHNL
jgi:hypothetical protein